MDVRVILTILTVASGALTLWGVAHGLFTARTEAARAARATRRLDELRDELGRELRAAGRDVEASNRLTEKYRRIHEGEGLLFPTYGNFDPSGARVQATILSSVLDGLRVDAWLVVSGAVCGAIAGVWSLWLPTG